MVLNHEKAPKLALVSTRGGDCLKAHLLATHLHLSQLRSLQPFFSLWVSLSDR